MTATPTKIFEHECYFDLSKHGGSYPWLLEVDFIHADRIPDMGGWTLITQLCGLVCNSKESKQKDLPNGSYASFHFRSKAGAERAINSVVAALKEMHSQDIGLRPSRATGRNRDLLMDILVECQPSRISPLF